jgi:hypothetical protein
MLSSRSSIKGKTLPGGLVFIDKAVLLWVCFHVTAFILLNRQMGAVVNQTGYIWDVLGGYFLLRFLVRNEADIYRSTKCLAIISVVLAICMVHEQSTGQNVFGQLGGVAPISEVRNGKIRSQGVFQHSLLAGAFGATTIPLFMLLWKNGKSKVIAVIGAVAGTVITITASCSTPLLAWVGGILAVCLWRIRNRMQLLRRSIVVAIICLSFLMNAPVWFLISRISLTDGSSSYHRAMLVDQFVRQFSDWYLVGTNDNQSWGGEGSDMWDTSNRYVEEGETGGLGAFICFLCIIYLGYSKLGSARRDPGTNRKKEWLFWFLGSALFAHTTAFFGVSYFDQTQMAWLLLLAMICAVTPPLRIIRLPPNRTSKLMASHAQPQDDLATLEDAKTIYFFTAQARASK